ncbi:phosphatase 2C-like domain-containing protein [Mycena maculata]|uniref:Phosphatase 2C-like domain-containing protein n=1 Tax=Mycena maculata TaxID=230809 RepID=A0AAD7J082_9AGAR|nr:phosphatase 2C-like domain-containing protein [Mycena maculata]
MAWSFWSVYDGHVGPQTARHLDRHLLPNLVGSLSILYSTVGQPETETIHSTIKRVFLSLDDEIVTKSVRHLVEKDAAGAPIRTMAALVLQAARAGSCALVAFYDANVRRLHVSCVGDSRAVLGRRCTTDDGRAVYDVHVLSADQTGHNPAEIARLTAEHPGEDKLFVRGRLLNWGPSRTFGNGVMKWSRELQTWMKEKCLGDKPYNDLLTPPYFTAEPEITTTAVEPGDFLVMASDGLWDCLTNEEVVGLVGVWLEANNGGAKAKGRAGTVIERTDLPVELIDKKTHYPTWKVQKRFVNVDANAARHLAHNALGGADEDLHRALMITPAPRARHFRDDVSAIVVFFE